jgi:hypothetical protein
MNLDVPKAVDLVYSIDNRRLASKRIVLLAE